MTKSPPLEGEELAAWTHTVVRNEALKLHRRRRHELDTAFDEISEAWLGDSPPAEDRVIESELIGQGREALGRINPDQARCLLLRADGLGYPEICETTGFSYAKVNRLLSEGRKAFHLHVGMIDSGKECDRVAPLLSQLADGEIALAARQDAHFHLENCLHCQGVLRDYSGTARDLSIYFPVAPLEIADAEHRGLLAQLGDFFHSLFQNLQARLAGHGVGSGAEIAAAKKVALAVGVSASLVAGGAAVHKASEEKPPAPAPKSTARPVTPTATSSESLTEKRAARRAAKQRAGARERRTTSQLESARKFQNDPALPDTTPLSDGTAADGAAASDPADAVPNSAPATSGESAGLAP